MKTPMDEKLLARFWRYIERGGAEWRCWLWTGAYRGGPPRGGKYGVLRIGNKSIPAMHLAYKHWRGQIPKGKVLDHVVCDTPLCCNPWHVEPRTNKQNILRGNGPTAINARKTHCIHGHPLSGDNLYISSTRTGRNCRRCGIDRVLAMRKRNKVGINMVARTKR